MKGQSGIRQVVFCMSREKCRFRGNPLQRHENPAQPGQAGFTLVEMLIALVLLSLLALGMVSALSTMGQTQERIDQRFARNVEDFGRMLRDTFGADRVQRHIDRNAARCGLRSGERFQCLADVVRLWPQRPETA